MSDARTIAWSFFERLGSGRIEDAVALLDDSGTYWVSAYGQREERPMPTMKEFYRIALQRVPMKFTLHDALVDGDRVALEVESYAETSNGVYNNRYCFVMTVRNGVIVHVREYVDTLHASVVLIPLIKDLVGQP